MPDIVAAGIDTLVVGFNVDRWALDEARLKYLDDAKVSAGERMFGSKDVTIELGGREFFTGRA